MQCHLFDCVAESIRHQGWAGNIILSLIEEVVRRTYHARLARQKANDEASGASGAASLASSLSTTGVALAT